MFDWIQFFEAEGIEYRVSGKNTKKGWTNICCIFCGDDDGFHLGCSPEGGWSCWRDSTHKGGGPTKLIQAIKGCTWEEARRIAGEDEMTVRAGSWSDVTAQAAVPDPVQLKALSWPAEFMKIRPEGQPAPFWNYLLKRKFDEADLPALIRYYDLRGVTNWYPPNQKMSWRDRLILPFQSDKGLLGWQGRALSKHAELRYLSYPGDVSKLILFNQLNALEGGEVLVIVEGPIDALKVDWYGKRDGIRAVGTLGTAFLDQQVAQIWKVAKKFEKVVTLFDPGAFGPAADLMTRLPSCDSILGAVPEGVEDAGALTPAQVVPAIRACF